jgi:hypothetical protein
LVHGTTSLRNTPVKIPLTARYFRTAQAFGDGLGSRVDYGILHPVLRVIFLSGRAVSIRIKSASVRIAKPPPIRCSTHQRFAFNTATYADSTEVRQWVLSFLLRLLQQQFALARHDLAVGDDQ